MPTFGSPLDAEVAATLWQERTLAVLSATFAALALLLAATGLYGLLSFLVASRRRDIGVRVAIGAARVDIVRLMVREAGRPLAVGVIVGVAAYAAGGCTVVAGVPTPGPIGDSLDVPFETVLGEPPPY